MTKRKEKKLCGDCGKPLFGYAKKVGVYICSACKKVSRLPISSERK